MERMYLTDCGSKPPIRFSACAKCGHSLLDEPPFNKDYAHANKVVVKKWEEDNHTIKAYSLRGCIPLLDKKGAIVKKLKNPILKEEVPMCHCWHNFASPIAGGTACALHCYDNKPKCSMLQASARLALALALLSAQRSKLFLMLFSILTQLITFYCLLLP